MDEIDSAIDALIETARSAGYLHSEGSGDDYGEAEAAENEARERLRAAIQRALEAR